MLWAIWNSWAGAAVAVSMALAVGGIAAALLLLRDHLRLEKHTLTLEAEVESLQDRVWQISESEELYRGLVEAQLDVIVQRDGSGRITFANEGYASLVGRPRQTLIGARTCPRVTEMGRVRPRTDGAKLVDEALETPDGVRWFAWIETPVHARNGAIEVLRAGREITERVVTERALADERTRAEAASEAKSRFLATVSHEFRTPLNGILGMADLLLDTPLDLEQNTYIRAIKTSGGALLSLIDEILDFSKIEAGKIDIASEPFDLQSLVEGIVELLAPKAQGKGIEIASHIAVGVPSRVIGDADRLRQILVNLAGNAVKFTDQGGVGIEVSSSDGRMRISVSDTGPGIAVDRIPQLFEEFEQGDGSPARKHGGTGLGLAISRRIVERMDGEITVDSAPGAGARFTITLPLPAAERSTNQMFKGKHDLSGKRYLVLARSPYEGPYILRKLIEAGASAAQTQSETDALARIATAADSGQPFDGLIVDCALGDDIARDTAAAAKEAGVERRIVLLSPFERRDLGSPSAAGFDAYLVKPLRARSLFERLTEKRPSEPDFVTARTTAPRVKPAPGGKAKRVLLAEDNEINALLALKALERLGAVVDWAKDGHEAFSLAEASFSGLRPDYDIVLMDIRMPGLDGLEATRRIRALEKTLGCPQPRRIIALTANALKEDETAAVEAGLDGFLAKPFDLKDLTDLLEDGARPMMAAS
jgi:PAS domain S-box-containing protein